MSKPTFLEGPKNRMPLLPDDDVALFNGKIIVISNPNFMPKIVRYTEDCHMFYEVTNLVQPVQPQ